MSRSVRNDPHGSWRGCRLGIDPARRAAHATHAIAYLLEQLARLRSPLPREPRERPGDAHRGVDVALAIVDRDRDGKGVDVDVFVAFRVPLPPDRLELAVELVAAGHRVRGVGREPMQLDGAVDKRAVLEREDG